MKESSRSSSVKIEEEYLTTQGSICRENSIDQEGQYYLNENVGQVIKLADNLID